MSAWMNRILKEFPVDLAQFWIAADPDGIMLDVHVLAALGANGFEVMLFEDSIGFRADYESRFRAAWDRGELGPAKALILHWRGSDTAFLPWDYLKQGRLVSLSLADLCPRLSYTVLRQLDVDLLERVYEVQAEYATQTMGDAATKEFLLTHLFHISPHLIKRAEDIWRELLRLHNRGKMLPTVLSSFVAKILESNPLFEGWPVLEMLTSFAPMQRLLQDGWRNYLIQQGLQGIPLRDQRAEYAERLIEIPFEHPDIRSVLVTMFIDGTLRPEIVSAIPENLPEWVKSGAQIDPSASRNLVENGLKLLSTTLPDGVASYHDWLSVARRYAEVLARFHQLDSYSAKVIEKSLEEFQKLMDTKLLNWLCINYGALPSIPIVKGPVMVHHIPRFLSLQCKRKEDRIALLVFDGLSLDQWVLIRDHLTRKAPNIVLDERACFAWLPTLTSVSRQALFAGEKPRDFADSIETTAKEPESWQRFWKAEGNLRSNQVFYQKGIKHEKQLDGLLEHLSNPVIKVAGLVIDTVDEVIHGAVLGKRGVASQILSWCESGFVVRLFNMLLELGFSVFLTADHGNIESTGIGRPNQGTVPDTRGERVRTYSSKNLVAETLQAYSGTYTLDIAGLPPSFIPVFANDRNAFVPKGEEIVVHGGPSAEEIIVPFIIISRHIKT